MQHGLHSSLWCTWDGLAHAPARTILCAGVDTLAGILQHGVPDTFFSNAVPYRTSDGYTIQELSSVQVRWLGEVHLVRLGVPAELGALRAHPHACTHTHARPLPQW